MKVASLLSSMVLGGMVAIAACASNDERSVRATPEGPRSGTGTGSDGGTDGGAPEGVLTDMVFPANTEFSPRSCTVTLTWTGSGSNVTVAGEFTDWAAAPLPMTKSTDGFELTLSPGPKLAGGNLYAYKMIVDGEWRLDPENRYRKIMGGQMNSALKMPACAAGPELLTDTMTTSASGQAKVTVRVRAAADGSRPRLVRASLDGQGIAASAFTFDPPKGAVTFSFQGLEKGKHRLSLRAVDEKDREAEPVDLPFWIEDEPFDYRDGILYMLLIDRFANGRKENDQPIQGPVHYDADFHGGDLQGALEVLESGYFEKLGVRTIWLSPLNTQTNRWHTGDGGQIFSAYHGYWPIKAREVEPRFGGDAALQAFVQKAHRRGIRVLLDLINNQVHDDHEYVTAHPDWFRKSCQCGDDANGCGWSVRPFDCLFQPYLPDINWTSAGAEAQFIDDAVSWISRFDLDGFRVDAVKHVEANSIYNMRAELTRRFEQAGARIFMVGETAVGQNDSGSFFGETFSDGFRWIDAYTGKTALDGQFDFPTRHNMADGLVNGDRPLDQVESEIQKAETQYRPGNHHVRFLNGHDNPRIASIAAKDPKLGCRWSDGCRDDALPPLAYDDPNVYSRLKRALAVLYTMPGVPYLYQGDEVAFGGGADPDMRRNMLFGGALATLEMARPSTSAPALTAAQLDLREHVRALGKTRNESRALRRGTRRPLVSEGDLWVYAYEAESNDVALVVINRGGNVVGRSFSAGTLSIGGISSWTSALGSGSASSQGSTLTVSLDAGQAAIFIAKK
jgi:glycosidase